MRLRVLRKPGFVLRRTKHGAVVTKELDEIELQSAHGPEPLLVNKSLRSRRHAVNAAVARETFF